METVLHFPFVSFPWPSECPVLCSVQSWCLGHDGGGAGWEKTMLEVTELMARSVPWSGGEQLVVNSISPVRDVTEALLCWAGGRGSEHLYPCSFPLAICTGQFIFSTVPFSTSNEENDKHC